MNEVILPTYSLPLVREVGNMIDKEGINKHPERKMDIVNVFVYVKKGTIQVIENGIEYLLTAGSYLFLRKGIHHWGEELYTPGTEWYYIHFYTQDLDNSDKHNEYSSFHQASIIVEDVYNTVITLPKQGSVRNPDYTELQLNQIIEEYRSSLPTRPLNLTVKTFQFFVYLYKDNLEENKNSNHRIVGQMIELFQSSTTKKLNSKQIADEIGMNYTYLSTLFREHTGKSITQFQNELLIEKAINLFKSNSLNITEVSNTLGFSNPFYFSRVFKKVTGVSPSTYLNQTYIN